MELYQKAIFYYSKSLDNFLYI